MLRTGIQARCERCGLNEFYVNAGIISAEEAIKMDGWDKRLEKLLCSECVADFDAMTDKFFNEIWDK